MVIEKEDVKYLDNNPQKGIIIDWKKVFKYYNQLGCPKNVFNPAKEFKPEEAEYHVFISTRSTGKTTNFLLVGMILNRMYGIQVPLIRQTDKMTAKQNMDRLTDVINTYRYVEKITDGEYNSTYYFAHKMHFVHIGEDGKVDKKSEPFLQALDIAHHEIYKSTLNMPTGDFIIFDEFISKEYQNNEWIMFLDLLKTILRDRLTGKIVMLANTTDYYNQYLCELMIQDEALMMQEDKPFIKRTPKGTRIYCQLIGNRNTVRAKVNTLYFGFENGKIASITGGSWSIDNYPHPEGDDDRKVLYKGQYLIYNGKVINLELCFSPTLGMHVIAHRASRLPNKGDTRIYTIDTITSWRQKYKFGDLKLDKKFWMLYNSNKWYFDNNDTGYTVETYVARANKL